MGVCVYRRACARVVSGIHTQQSSVVVVVVVACLQKTKRKKYKVKKKRKTGSGNCILHVFSPSLTLFPSAAALWLSATAACIAALWRMRSSNRKTCFVSFRAACCDVGALEQRLSLLLALCQLTFLLLFFDVVCKKPAGVGFCCCVRVCVCCGTVGPATCTVRCDVTATVAVVLMVNENVALTVAKNTHTHTHVYTDTIAAVYMYTIYVPSSKITNIAPRRNKNNNNKSSNKILQWKYFHLWILCFFVFFFCILFLRLRLL